MDLVYDVYDNRYQSKVLLISTLTQGGQGHRLQTFCQSFALKFLKSIALKFKQPVFSKVIYGISQTRTFVLLKCLC